MENNGIPHILNTLKSRWFTNEFIANNPEIVEQRIKQVINTNPRVFLNVFRIYANTEMSPWLKELLIPTLVLTGENDGACNPRLNKLIADIIPTSKLVILPKYKHSILIEAPDEISKNLIEFML